MAWQLYDVDSGLFSEKHERNVNAFSLLWLVIQREPVSVIGVSLLAQPVSGGGQTWMLQWAVPRGSVFWLWDKTAWCACLRANLLQSCPTLWDSLGFYVAHQAPLSVGFPRQEYGTGLLWPPPGDLPDPEIKPASFMSPADSLPLVHLGSPRQSWLWGYFIAWIEMDSFFCWRFIDSCFPEAFVFSFNAKNILFWGVAD